MKKTMLAKQRLNTQEEFMNRQNFFNKALLIAAFAIFPFGFSACDDDGLSSDDWKYSDFRISVQNKTNATLALKLVVGEIPSPNARYEDFLPIADEAFPLQYDNYEEHRLSAKGVGPVYRSLPLAELARQWSDTDTRVIELQERLQKKLMNKLISFIFTISLDDTIIYQMAGWDLPDDDMIANHINEKCCGYYDTTEDKWLNDDGIQCRWPLLYSKLWKEGTIEAHHPNSPVYYVRVNALDSIALQGHGFEAASNMTVNGNEYWKTH
jgi:hypothetical protein